MIRFLCTATSTRPGSWGQLSYDYLLGLSKTHVRAISVTGAADLYGGDAWERLAPLFTTPLAEFDTNIVCAPIDYLDRLWTAGVQNIAIVGGPLHAGALPKSLEVLNRYDQVWTPYQTESVVDYYFNTKYVPPWACLESPCLLP